MLICLIARLSRHSVKLKGKLKDHGSVTGLWQHDIMGGWRHRGNRGGLSFSGLPVPHHLQRHSASTFKCLWRLWGRCTTLPQMPCKSLSLINYQPSEWLLHVSPSFDWQHTAPQHLIKRYNVCICKRSRSHHSNVVQHTFWAVILFWGVIFLRARGVSFCILYVVLNFRYLFFQIGWFWVEFDRCYIYFKGVDLFPFGSVMCWWNSLFSWFCLTSVYVLVSMSFGPTCCRPENGPHPNSGIVLLL